MAHRPKSEIKGFHWKMRRVVDNVTTLFQRGTTVQYPQTSDALSRLRQAVGDEMKTVRNRVNPTYPKMKERNLPSGPSRKHYQRWLRMKRENDQLRSKLASHTAAKAGGNFISPEWIVRISLTSPGANARGLTKSFRDVVGLDKHTVGRDSIDKVRGAWVEFYKSMVLKLGAERVALAVAAAKSTRAGFALIFIVQVQDEADIRLRSGEADGFAISRRSRASKVQQNVVELVTNSGSLDIPTELEALGD